MLLKKTLKHLAAYIDVYRYVGTGSKSMKEMKAYLMEELQKPESTARQCVNGAVYEEESLLEEEFDSGKCSLNLDRMLLFMEELDDIFEYSERGYLSYELKELQDKVDKLQLEIKDQQDYQNTRTDLWNSEKRKLSKKAEKQAARIQELERKELTWRKEEGEWFRKSREWDAYFDKMEQLRQKIEANRLVCKLIGYERGE